MQDLSFLLNRLAVLNSADLHPVRTGRPDLRWVGTFGMSLGGIVACAVCLAEPRVRACQMMDAPMPTDVVTTGLLKPGRWITRDAEIGRAHV